MVTKTQFPLKSHRDIALVPLNKRRRSDGGSGASPSSTSLASTAASSPPRGRVAASQTSIDTPPSATPLRLIFTRARIGPRWGGAQDNESYGGISIKTQKANMRKSEFLMLEALKSAPHLNDKLSEIASCASCASIQWSQPCACWMAALTYHREAHRILQ